MITTTLSSYREIFPVNQSFANYEINLTKIEEQANNLYDTQASKYLQSRYINALEVIQLDKYKDQPRQGYEIPQRSMGNTHLNIIIILLLTSRPKNRRIVSKGRLLHQIYNKAKTKPSPMRQIDSKDAIINKLTNRYTHSHKKSAQVDFQNSQVSALEIAKKAKYIENKNMKLNRPWKNNDVNGLHRLSSKNVSEKVQGMVGYAKAPRLNRAAIIKAAVTYVRATKGF